jgi:hypothetical protein
MIFLKGGPMNKKESIVRMVSGCVNEVVCATENIHRSIAQNTAASTKAGFREGGVPPRVYDTIRAVNSTVETLVLRFFA